MDVHQYCRYPVQQGGTPPVVLPDARNFQVIMVGCSFAVASGLQRLPVSHRLNSMAHGVLLSRGFPSRSSAEAGELT